MKTNPQIPRTHSIFPWFLPCSRCLHLHTSSLHHPDSVSTTIRFGHFQLSPEANQRHSALPRITELGLTPTHPRAMDGDRRPANAMANKYCDHHATHNCSNLVSGDQKLCAPCAAGRCQ